MPMHEATMPIASERPISDVRFLGICWFLYGVMCLAAASLLIAFSGTATVMFGALLSRVPFPFTLMDLFHVWYALAVIETAVCGVFAIVAAGGLGAGSRWARPAMLIAGFLALPQLPLGIMLGTYTLIVLLPGVSREMPWRMRDAA